MSVPQHAVRAGLMLFVLGGVAAVSAQTRPVSAPVPKEVPDTERIAKAPSPWEVELMPKCVRCTFPEWPRLPADESVRFRLHVVVVEDGTVGSVRITDVLRGDRAARPAGVEGRVPAALRRSPTAVAGLALLERAREWRFARPFDYPLLLTIDIGSTTPEPARERADGELMRVGRDVQPPKKILNVNPVYPPEALKSRVTGSVIIEAEIGRTGEVGAMRVLRGDPMLDEAALAAVRQWRYEPVVIAGEPVPVLMTVTVTFSLGQPE